jgi:hypothetical protein
MAGVNRKLPVFALTLAVLAWADGPSQTVWNIDSIEKIGGHPATVLGHPKVIDTDKGKAVLFNGVDDAIFLDTHPLTGAETWTWEVLFRPDSGGAEEQRFFHFQETGTQNRMLFEIRVLGPEGAKRWCLDSYAMGGTGLALMDRAKLHPMDTFHWVEAVYDGTELRNYVDGVLQGRGAVKLQPQKAGGTSLGVRYTKVNYFKGAIAKARMTPRALAVEEFLK